MIYIIGRKSEMSSLPPMDETMRRTIENFVEVLDCNYGEDRDIYNNDGGYVMYVSKGTPLSDVREVFDYTTRIPEYAEYNPPMSIAMYLLNNEYSVMLVMHADDTPMEILRGME